MLLCDNILQKSYIDGMRENLPQSGKVLGFLAAAPSCSAERVNQI
ncbi:hypothetical protein CPter91_2630 [Collimonas pratensis]|uniref:Uncharacterized protein n=1 Tax=Collimonas pratensis TaxID=279113 RepID=A0A127Q4G7_9BURK|nr:hypothetical protein CPter91_2630 [Collimonas pratensis]